MYVSLCAHILPHIDWTVDLTRYVHGTKNVILFLTDVSAITCLAVANNATKEAISAGLFNYREGFSPSYVNCPHLWTW